jgi:hypothetical protein
MKTTREKIERIIISGPLEEYKEAHTYCQKNGFRIIQANPFLTDEKNKNRASCFEITAEKELKGA